MGFNSWGRFPAAQHRQVAQLHWPGDRVPDFPESYLPYGNGRSYGDCCLNDGANLVVARGLDRIREFDREHGIVRVEPGITYGELLAVIVPAGWFMPVTPGTQFVTIGGAVANDVHGKNHHRAGTLGSSILALSVWRSDRGMVRCAPNLDEELFKATIGGIGLTGLITEVTVQLRAIESSYVCVEELPFEGLDEFFSISDSSEHSHEHTVAWVDCVRPAGLRGIFMRGNHASSARCEAAGIDALPKRWRHDRALRIPIDLPSFVLSSPGVRAFNLAYYHRHASLRRERLQPLGGYFYPLDSVGEWNRMYGRAGFFQFQCAIPRAHRSDAMREIFERIRRSGQGSFLAVLKEFGDVRSPGMLSFPLPGTTLALDFAHRGSATVALLSELEAVTVQAGGRLYAAKDALMSASSFQTMYPEWERIERLRDPRISSSFWRRVTGEGR